MNSIFTVAFRMEWQNDGEKKRWDAWPEKWVACQICCAESGEIRCKKCYIEPVEMRARKAGMRVRIVGSG